MIGEPAFCLERGACVHYAPRNSASFLINAACKLVYRLTGTSRFFAYGDPMAGEYGGVYQAAGWAYLGQGLDRQKTRQYRTFVLAPGAEDKPSNWKTTRALRRDGANLTYDEAEALGWRLAKAKDKEREAKHVYATNVGRDRKSWLQSISTKPYPTPRPDLKLGASRSL